MAALSLAACGSFDWSAERATALRTVEAPPLASTDVEALLAVPLDRDAALRLALVNSPEFNRLLAWHQSELAEAQASGRLANPRFSYERLTSPEGLDIERWVSLGVIDLLTWPQRQRLAAADLESVRVQLAMTVLDRMTEVRQAWVRAVAAGEKRGYAERVLASAEASAELARRMESVGNFNPLERARQQSYEADAQARLTFARQHELEERESLVRLLGLNAEQAAALQLPARLPDLPIEPRSPADVSANINATRLDLRLANATWQSMNARRGLTGVNSVAELELALREGEPRGFEVEVMLPIFDLGDLQRTAARAWAESAMQALKQTSIAASSDLRVSYSAYRSAFENAVHHRDVLVPLRRAMSEEALLRYNGMLIGVFELLADARDQIDTVVAAIEAHERFWLAEATLQASLLGRPGVVR